jgi:hypothetical protein
MKRLLISLVSVALLFAGVAIVQSQQGPAAQQQDHTRPFMRAKLVGSQSVLNGLVTENFELIHRGAQDMKKMSEAVQWPRAEDKVYEHYSAAFRMQCDKLMQQAEKKNLEGAHFTYLNMTTTCIDCHDYVRGAFRVERDQKDPQGPVRLIPTEWEGNTFRKGRSESNG